MNPVHHHNHTESTTGIHPLPFMVTKLVIFVPGVIEVSDFPSLSSALTFDFSLAQYGHTTKIYNVRYLDILFNFNFGISPHKNKKGQKKL